MISTHTNEFVGRKAKDEDDAETVVEETPTKKVKTEPEEDFEAFANAVTNDDFN